MKIDKETISSRIADFASSYGNIAAAYLFGSGATDRMRPSSDLDIALMSTCDIDGFQKIEIETRLSNLLGMDVDAVIFHQADTLLQHQILKYGTLLYERDQSTRVKQETRARREYLDTRFLFRELMG